MAAPGLPARRAASMATDAPPRRPFRRVNVEITNRCNLACPFCAPTARQAAAMPVPAFAGLATQLAPLAEEVVPHLLGEPLMHPDLAGILAGASAAGLPVHVVTNGVLLGPAQAALLLRPAVRQVSVSLQSAFAGLPRAELGGYLDRVLGFCDLALSERPDLYINLRLWNALGPRAGILGAPLEERLSAHFGQDFGALEVDVRRRKNVPLRRRQYLHFDTRFEWPRLDRPEASPRGTCHALSGHFGILVDGTVVPCCLDAEGVLALGNAFQAPLTEILAGARARRIRDGFAVGRREEALCRRCTFVERFARQASRMSSGTMPVRGAPGRAGTAAGAAEPPTALRCEGARGRAEPPPGGARQACPVEDVEVV